jgi:predicted dehydrogenase
MNDDVAIVGTGFVADLYMRSLRTFPHIRVAGAFDRDPARLARFAAHWGVPAAPSLEALIAGPDAAPLVLNLTNPDQHHAVSRACLEAGRHVWSEKPLATEMAQARALHALAAARGLMLASAPCSLLGETAQVLWKAVREGVAGTPRLVYAELDDGFIPAAPYARWFAESGAPWPWEDEFRTGCTLEHAGYALTWLMAMFGPVRTVAAAAAELLPDKLAAAGGGPAAPDFSCATLFFEGGMVARLTCSILARHDHRLRVICDDGTLEVDEGWDNAAPVRLRRRFTVRRRLIESPLTRRLRPDGPTHPKVGRRGAAAMNFALGPAEMLDALREGRPCRLSADFALHLTEVTLAIQNAGETAGAQAMTTRFAPIAPMPWADGPRAAGPSAEGPSAEGPRAEGTSAAGRRAVAP